MINNSIVDISNIRKIYLPIDLKEDTKSEYKKIINLLAPQVNRLKVEIDSLLKQNQMTLDDANEIMNTSTSCFNLVTCLLEIVTAHQFLITQNLKPCQDH